MPGKKRPSKAAQAAARRLDDWMRQVDADRFARAEALPLRRDMVILLTYVRDNRAVGTQSTGNLPLKAVREVIARFVHPLEMETTIGDRTFRVRSEYEVWPLYFLHTLAEGRGTIQELAAFQITPFGKGLLASLVA